MILQAPPHVISFSCEGVNYQVKDGFIEVEPNVAKVALSHGFEPAKPKAAKPAPEPAALKEMADKFYEAVEGDAAALMLKAQTDKAAADQFYEDLAKPKRGGKPTKQQ